MSPDRQPAGDRPVLDRRRAGTARDVGLAIELGPTEGFPLHVHDHHQLALAARGVVIMSGVDRSWVLPRTRALWIPAGVPHSVAVSGRTTMLSTYVRPDQCPGEWDGDQPTVVEASGLLGELVTRLSQPDLPADQRRRAEAVLWDVMVPLPVTTLSLPLPRDERARRVADALLADLADRRSLAAWGRAVGASERTLARLFAAETGMGFERWRTMARLAAALPLLAGGTPVATTAHRVGYATPSAFVAAFRREIGTTPADYFRPA